MPTFAAELGMQAASQAASGLIGTGMGLLLEGHNDRRQLRQQEKLQNLEKQVNVLTGWQMFLNRFGLPSMILNLLFILYFVYRIYKKLHK